MKEALHKSSPLNFNPAAAITGATLVVLIVLLFGLYINERGKVAAFSENVAELKSELVLLKSRESTLTRTIAALNDTLSQANKRVPSKVEAAAAEPPKPNADLLIHFERISDPFTPPLFTNTRFFIVACETHPAMKMKAHSGASQT